MRRQGNRAGFKSLFSSKGFAKFFQLWYNLPIQSDREVSAVESREFLSYQDDARFGFLYRDCSCYAPSMKYWLSIPEFRNEIASLRDNGTRVSNEIVLPVMQRIYDQKLEERRELRKKGFQSDFQAGLAKSGIRSIRNAINSH